MFSSYGGLHGKNVNKNCNYGRRIYTGSYLETNRMLIRTKFKRAYHSSSKWEYYSKKYARLKDLFLKLQYPTNLVDSTISQFLTSVTKCYW